MLWVFGFEGGLAGRPELLLLSSCEISGSVAFLAHKCSILSDVITTASWCFVVLMDRDQGSGDLRDPGEASSPGGGLSLSVQC